MDLGYRLGMHLELVFRCLSAFAGGALLWTLAEYGLHRFVFHELPGSALGAREHRMHHADPSWFAPWTKKAAAAIGVTCVLLPAAWLAAGLVHALAFTAGFVVLYLAYEVLHRRVHTHAPRGRYGRWRRRNHLAHHFTDPRRAHGVTSPVWDHVFGTAIPRHRVSVPPRLAPAWMCSPDGALAAGLEGDYELRGQPAARRGEVPANAA